MYLLKFKTTLFATLLTFSIIDVQAHDGHSSGSCRASLSKPGQVFLNAETVTKEEARNLKRDAEIITDIAAKLGLETPPHQLNIVPSEQLNILAVSGGHAAPHWTDGANLIKSLAQSMGVLEFVTPGCPTCRGYYSASTPYLEQLSVIMHVMGHNDMAVNSMYANVRPSDSPLSSLQLARKLTETYRTVNHDQVSLYFQFLKSLGHLQDYVYGTYEAPEKFDPKRMQTLVSQPGASIFDSIDQNYLHPQTRGLNRWSKTGSILQFMVRNLPDTAPDWQRDLVSLYEQTQRVYPAIFNNKIMNEGWATLMQYLIARHSPWNTSKQNVTFAQLLAGVAFPSLSNPYWLGLSGWNNLYMEFRDRPEIKGLSEVEKDKHFISWARKMYADKNDSEWAKVALNERWINEQKLFLYRQTQTHELDSTKPFDKQKYVALSRDWKRVRNFIIRNYIDVKYLFRPNISVRNPALSARPGTVELVQDISSGFPLEITASSKTLFVLSQLLLKPVSIKALFTFKMNLPPKERDDSQYTYPQPGAYSGSVPYSEPFPTRTQFQKVKLLVQLTVHPNGQIELVGSDKKTQEQIGDAQEIIKALKESVSLFQTDVIRSFRSELMSFESNKWNKLATQVSDSTVNNIADVIYYAPTTNSAVREYLDLIERRLRSSLMDAINGKSSIQFGKKGVKLSVLPEIPEFRYDFQYIDEHIGQKPVGPIDYPGAHNPKDFDLDDNGTIVSPGRYLPGDRFGKRPEEQEGQGQGQGQDKEQGNGEEDGEGDGDPEGNDGHGQGQGQGPGGGSSPTNLEIPLQLYGELLTELLELPNIRRTEGQEAHQDLSRRGSTRRTNGNVLWDQTLMMAVEKARALRKASGRPYDASVSMTDLIHEALKLIEPADYFVSDSTPEPQPDFDAVLVVSVDMTGSMYGDRITNAKNLLYNLKALLKAKYKNVIIRYVAFSDHAVEMNEKDIFSKYFGGGTAYAPAVVKSREILDEYPNNRYNKYVLTIGDGETPDGDAYAAEIDKLKDQLQYAGFAATNTQDAAAAVIEPLRQIKSQWPWLGITTINDTSEIFRALQDLFPKGGKLKED